MSAQVIIGIAESLGARPLSWERDELAEMIDGERDEELAAVVDMLRRDSSSAYLCGAESLARIYDAIVSRLEHLEHRR